MEQAEVWDTKRFSPVSVSKRQDAEYTYHKVTNDLNQKLLQHGAFSSNY
jgi:hypothetical protein